MVASSSRAAWCLAAAAPLLLLSLRGEVQPQIWHGQGVPAGAAPWLSHLHMHSDGDACTASLVSPFHILTAAHCVGDPLRPASDILVTLNATDYKTAAKNWTVAKVFVHSDFKPGSKSIAGDIAVLQLSQRAAGIPTMPLVNSTTAPQFEANGTPVVVAGWGYTDRHVYPATARYADVTVIDNAECKKRFPPPFGPIPWPKLESDMLCSMDTSGHNRSDCNGDSGGPLFHSTAPLGTQGASFVQIGIVSWGTLCGGPPDVFTRVSTYASWVRRVIAQHGSAGGSH